jgi:hypothetical protein
MTARRRPYGPIDPAALVQFEHELPSAIPSDLRQFLLESNGADVSCSAQFEQVPGGTALGEIFGLHAGPEYFRLDHMARQFADSLPESILVFAADAYGNYFGISLAGKDLGAVYFVDHETLPATRDSLIRVADSFTEFMTRAGCDFTDAPVPTTIAEAIDLGDNEALIHLLAAGSDGSGAVHHAVLHGDLRILETVLRQGGDPNERGAIGGTETPLFVAARQGRADMADALIRYGADPNLRCGSDGTALQMAKPWPEVIEVLRSAGAKS